MNPQTPAVRQEPITLEGLIKRSAFTQRFNEVLGKKAPSFMSSLIAVGKSMPDVQPRSIIASAMNAAILDLPIDKNLGFAWLVPYRDGGIKIALFQIGAKGFIQLALRSGCYAGMNALAINKEALNGYTELGQPRIDWTKYDPAKPVAGYFFGYSLSNAKDCVWTFYWSKERVQSHAQRYSEAYRKGKGPWKTHFDAMALKTVVKNELSDWGILSIDFQRGLLVDQSVSLDVDSAPQFPDTAGTDAMGLEDVGVTPAELTEGEWQREKDAKLADPNPITPLSVPAVATLPVEIVATPRTPTTAPTLVEEELTPQQHLENFVIHDQGHTFDIFIEWAKDAGVPNADTWATFADVPTKLAKRLSEAPTGLAKGLKAVLS